MVKESVTTLYICEFCQKEYSNINDAEKVRAFVAGLLNPPESRY